MRRTHLSHIVKFFRSTAAIPLLACCLAWLSTPALAYSHGGGGHGGGGWHGGGGGWHGCGGGWHGGYGGWHGGYGGWRGGYGGWGWRGGYGRWGGWWGGIGLGFADPFYWDWPYYGYGYPSYWPPAYAYAAPPPAVQQVPMVSAAPPSWYYCNSPAGYYPYVQSCSVPWRQVPATPPPPPAAQH